MNILRKTGDAAEAAIETRDIWGNVAISAGAVALGVIILAGVSTSPEDGHGRSEDSTSSVTNVEPTIPEQPSVEFLTPEQDR